VLGDAQEAFQLPKLHRHPRGRRAVNLSLPAARVSNT
jgi:hypothetical protein